MILQIGADAGQVPHHRDPQALQASPVADAGALQNGGAGHRARREDDLAPRPDGAGDAAPQYADAARPALLRQHPVDQHIGYHRQIGTPQRRAQEAARRAPAAAALLVDVEIAATLVAAGVEILAARNAGAFGGLDEGIEHPPAQARLLDAPFAAGA